VIQKDHITYTHKQQKTVFIHQQLFQKYGCSR